MAKARLKTPGKLGIIAGLSVLGFCGLGGAEPQDRSTTSAALSQGIRGTVLFWHGFFVFPDDYRQYRKPVERELRIYELTTLDPNDVDIVSIDSNEGNFFSAVHTGLVAVVQSECREGRFEIELPPGRYSVFAVEDGQFYARNLTPGGEINPVHVRLGTFADIEFDITYGATWVCCQ